MALTGGELWAIVPVKPFGQAKSRLQDVLAAQQRADLARRLQSHTLDVLGEILNRQRILVVSGDEDALRLAEARGVQLLVESGNGLNPALREAAGLIGTRSAASLLIVAADLPLLAAADVAAMLEASEGVAVTIAPDRAGTGTNALLLRPPGVIDFAFGVESYRQHCSLAEAAGAGVRTVVRDGLAFDLDLPADLNELLLQAGPEWLDLWPQSVQA